MSKCPPSSVFKRKLLSLIRATALIAAEALGRSGFACCQFTNIDALCPVTDLVRRTSALSGPYRFRPFGTVAVRIPRLTNHAFAGRTLEPLGTY